VKQAEELLDGEQVKAAHELLRELIGEDFDIDQGGVPRLHRGTLQRSGHRDGRYRDAPRPQEQPAALRWLQALRCGHERQRAADLRGARRAWRRDGRAAG
jgi:hypothetical protein